MLSKIYAKYFLAILKKHKILLIQLIIMMACALSLFSISLSYIYTLNYKALPYSVDNNVFSVLTKSHENDLDFIDAQSAPKSIIEIFKNDNAELNIALIIPKVTNDIDLHGASNKQNKVLHRIDYVTSNLFEIVNAKYEIGAVNKLQQNQVVVSFDYWKNHLGHDIGVLGESLNIDGKNYQISAVMDSKFQSPTSSQLDYSLSAKASAWVIASNHEIDSFSSQNMIVGLLETNLNNRQLSDYLNTDLKDEYLSLHLIEEEQYFEVLELRDYLYGKNELGSFILLICSVILLLVVVAGTTITLKILIYGRLKECALKRSIGIPENWLINENAFLLGFIVLVSFVLGLGVLVLLLQGLVTLEVIAEGVISSGSALLAIVLIHVFTFIYFIIVVLYPLSLSINKQIIYAELSSSKGSVSVKENPFQKLFIFMQIFICTLILMLCYVFLVNSLDSLKRTDLQSFDEKQTIQFQFEDSISLGAQAMILNELKASFINIYGKKNISISSADPVGQHGVLMGYRGTRSASVYSGNLSTQNNNVYRSVGNEGSSSKVNYLVSIVYVDDTYFDLMQIHPIEGRLEFDDNNSIIITESAKNAIFGDDTNILDQNIFAGPMTSEDKHLHEGLRVSGVVNDLKVNGSDIKSKLLGSVPVIFRTFGNYDKRIKQPSLLSITVKTSSFNYSISNQIFDKYNNYLKVISIVELQNEVADRTLVNRLLTYFMISLIVISLFVIVVSTWSFVSTLCNNKRKEFSIRLSLGASKHSICIALLRELVPASVIAILLASFIFAFLNNILKQVISVTEITMMHYMLLAFTMLFIITLSSIKPIQKIFNRSIWLNIQES